jgi:hypothetical protein
MREHNRLAELLKNQHPSWNDEKLYEEARRIVIAEYQHIIYKEWLPHILGLQSMKESGLYPLQDGYVVNYHDEDDFDPRITNEFAVAAFRFGHSLIPSSFKKITRNRQSRAQDLKTLFFNPKSFTEEEGMCRKVHWFDKQFGKVLFLNNKVSIGCDLIKATWKLIYENKIITICIGKNYATSIF